MLSNIMRYQAIAMLGGGSALAAGSYQATGTNTGAPTTLGGWTSTSNFTNGNENDTSSGVAPSSGNVLTCLDVQSVIGLPGEVSMTINYDGTVTVTVSAWNGSSWDTLSDISGTTWTPHIGTASESKVLAFAPGSTTYTAWRVVVSATTLTTVTDCRIFPVRKAINTSNIRAQWSANGNLFSDTACSTYRPTNAGAIGGWQDYGSGSSRKAIQATGGNQPTRVRMMSTISGWEGSAHRGGLLTTDDPASPTVAKWLRMASFFNAAMGTAYTVLIVYYRPSSVNNTGYMADDEAHILMMRRDGTTAITAGDNFKQTPTRKHSGSYQGVISSRYDNAYFYSGYMGVENAEAATGDTTISGQPIRIGDYDGTTGANFRGYILEVLAFDACLTKTQLDNEVASILSFYGLTSYPQIVAAGNSITDGFGGYNDPWYNHFNDYISPDAYVYEDALAGRQTTECAANIINASLERNNGSYKRGSQLTITGTPSRTAVQLTGAAWTTNEHAGKRIVMEDGGTGVAGMGAHIVSNTSDTLTLTGTETPGGLPTAPAAGDKCRIYETGTTSAKTLYFAWEITNHLKTLGNAGGPTTNSSVKNNTPVWTNYLSWCCAARALGFKVAACTMLPRSDGGLGSNWSADWTILNGWIRSDYTIFADVLADINTVADFADVAAQSTYPASWLDGAHPSNAGGLLIASYMAGVAGTVFV